MVSAVCVVHDAIVIVVDVVISSFCHSICLLLTPFGSSLRMSRIFRNFFCWTTDRQFCCCATLFLSWLLHIYRCRSRNFCVSAVFLCVCGYVCVASLDPAIHRVACIATNLFWHAEQIKYSTIFNLARVIEKWWNSEINYNVKWPRKRNDRHRVTNTSTVCATQWLMSVWMPRSFTTIRFGLSPFSDGPDHDNDTDIKHIKNYTNSIRSLHVVVAFNSLLFSLCAVFHSVCCDGNNVFNCVCILHLSRSQWLCKRGKR